MICSDIGDRVPRWLPWCRTCDLLCRFRPHPRTNRQRYSRSCAWRAVSPSFFNPVPPTGATSLAATRFVKSTARQHGGRLQCRLQRAFSLYFVRVTVTAVFAGDNENDRVLRNAGLIRELALHGAAHNVFLEAKFALRSGACLSVVLDVTEQMPSALVVSAAFSTFAASQLLLKDVPHVVEMFSSVRSAHLMLVRLPRVCVAPTPASSQSTSVPITVTVDLRGELRPHLACDALEPICSQLCELIAPRAVIALRSFPQIADCVQLRTLDLTGASNLCDTDLPAVAALPNLTALFLGKCKLLRDFSCLPQCRRLVELSLAEAFITTQQLPYLGELPYLETLSLAATSMVTDYRLLSGCQYLVSLDLSATAVTGETLAALSCSLQFLRALNVKLCDRLSAQDFAVLHRNRSLQFVALNKWLLPEVLSVLPLRVTVGK